MMGRRLQKATIRMKIQKEGGACGLGGEEKDKVQEEKRSTMIQEAKISMRIPEERRRPKRR